MSQGLGGQVERNLEKAKIETGISHGKKSGEDQGGVKELDSLRPVEKGILLN